MSCDTSAAPPQPSAPHRLACAAQCGARLAGRCTVSSHCASNTRDPEPALRLSVLEKCWHVHLQYDHQSELQTPPYYMSDRYCDPLKNVREDVDACSALGH